MASQTIESYCEGAKVIRGTLLVHMVGSEEEKGVHVQEDKVGGVIRCGREGLRRKGQVEESNGDEGKGASVVAHRDGSVHQRAYDWKNHF
ncbi:hypothetical protein ACMD2_13824 [Ananas comosus]|uniref:Uncharacterized protein n=1 Tax=Ananas comosus TaxID=4615 RepID=A0A199VM53_ANACO|nr:hypothetical protein ACMD2_13824 [Ananas comosus]